MPIEVVGQQLRIRLKSPKQFTQFRTQDVGTPGKLQRLAGYSRKTGWMTQAWRINLSDYNDIREVKRDINRLKISEYKKKQAIKVANNWWYSNFRTV